MTNETWNYKLWIDNDQGLSENCQELAREALSGASATEYSTTEQEAQCSLAETLKAQCEEMAEEFIPQPFGPFAELLGEALSRINWHEIAQSLLDQAIEEDNYTETDETGE